MTDPSDVVILCGGRGTRLHPESTELPKPLVTIGDQPIVEHLMQIYVDQVRDVRFILATGHLGHCFVERYESSTSVVVLDTGNDTGTGERIRQARAAVRGDTFFATYGDGLANVDLDALLALHRASNALLTLTTVPLPSPYGTLELDDAGRVRSFREKPRLTDHWINGGFFVCEHSAFDLPGESLEDDVLPALAHAGQLQAHRHTGFWRSMDTFKDRQELDALAQSETPWRG